MRLREPLPTASWAPEAVPATVCRGTPFVTAEGRARKPEAFTTTLDARRTLSPNNALRSVHAAMAKTLPARTMNASLRVPLLSAGAPRGHRRGASAMAPRYITPSAPLVSVGKRLPPTSVGWAAIDILPDWG